MRVGLRAAISAMASLYALMRTRRTSLSTLA